MPRCSKQLAVRDEFLILTNGRQTEKNYFEAIRANYRSIFKINVKFMNDDPVALVNHAIAERPIETGFGACLIRTSLRPLP